MKTLIKTLAVVLLLPSLLYSNELNKEQFQAYVAFQKDADIIRLKHLEYYSKLLQEFNKITGSFPFMEEASVPLYVHVASPEQIPYAKLQPPYEHKTKSVKEFVQVIEKKLGREIEEFYDPQYRPDYKPNFYIYMAHRGTFYFAIHQHQSYPFSKNISKYYNKVEITNHPNTHNNAHGYKDLIISQEFRESANREIMKPNFFLEREQKFIKATKM